MIAHSKLTKCRMLDWIKSRIERGEAMPTDEEIVDRFILSGVESARVLLSDLADEGAIEIAWNAPGRPITLGRRERAQAPLPRVVPSVVKADAAIDAGVDKIMRIVKGGTKPCQPNGAGSSTGTPAFVNKTTAIVNPAATERARLSFDVETTPGKAVPAALADAVVPRDVGQPAPSPSPAIKRLPTVPGRDLARTRTPRPPVTPMRQINSRVTLDGFAALEELAAAEGKSVSGIATMLIEKALTARQAPKPSLTKPRIPAAVMAAYQADGRGFADFIGHLLTLGLAQYKAEAAEVST